MGAMGRNTAIYEAGGNGFEPLLTVPETVVLPLDEPPKSTEENFTTPHLLRLGCH